ALLAAEKRGLIDQEDVIDPSAIKTLVAVHIVQVEGIVWSVFAGCLYEGAGAERFAVGQVLLQREAVPIVYFEGYEAAVVVAVTNAGVNTHATGELAVATACRGAEGRTAIHWATYDG